MLGGTFWATAFFFGIWAQRTTQSMLALGLGCQRGEPGAITGKTRFACRSISLCVLVHFCFSLTQCCRTDLFCFSSHSLTSLAVFSMLRCLLVVFSFSLSLAVTLLSLCFRRLHVYAVHASLSAFCSCCCQCRISSSAAMLRAKHTLPQTFDILHQFLRKLATPDAS
jgi:hypothetical protein